MPNLDDCTQQPHTATMTRSEISPKYKARSRSKIGCGCFGNRD